MDLGAQQEASLRMPIPMNYGSIHESSKFRMLGGPTLLHSGSSSLNGTPAPQSSAGVLHPPRSAPPAPAAAVASVPSAAAAPAGPPQPSAASSQSKLEESPPPPAASTARASPGPAAGSSEQQQHAMAAAGAGALPSTKKPIKYRECLKNHAANLGGHALDGCGEFMPSGEEGSLEALKCAACGCHRNFHRREVEGEQMASVGGCNFCSYSPRAAFQSMKDQGRRRYTPLAAALPPVHPPLALPPPPRSPSMGGLPSRSLQMALHSPPEGTTDDEPHLHYSVSGHHVGTMQPQQQQAGGAMHHHHHHSHPHHPGSLHFGGHSNSSASSLKKRFRTKFSSEQKERMFNFAEKLGWRIQKHDEAAVHQFCAEVGVKRHVFKVWMHNNKNTFAKKLLPNEGGVQYVDNGGSSPTTSSGNMQP